MLPDNHKKDNNKEKGKPEEHTDPAANNEAVLAAHEQAEADIEKDPDLSIYSPTDDLDEGELARLNDDDSDLI